MNGKDTKDSLGKDRERVADLLKQYFESAATRTRENEPPDDGDTNLHWSYTLLIDGRSGLPKEISKPANAAEFGGDDIEDSDVFLTLEFARKFTKGTSYYYELSYVVDREAGPFEPEARYALDEAIAAYNEAQRHRDLHLV
ncbi:MAG TPA: hypothetical protein VJG48_02225 [Candidatus Paceibacterota bacterium]